MSQFRLPDLGEGLPDAEIHTWYVNEGDEVELDQPLASMETAKAIVDIPSPFKGKITKLHGKAGDIILTGSILIEYEGEELHESKHHGHNHVHTTNAATVAGKIEQSDRVIHESACGITTRSTSTSIANLASPAVRAMAQQLNIRLEDIQGTGPYGIIQLKDLQQHLPKAQQKAPEDYEPLRGTRRTMLQAMTLSHREVVPVTLFDEADITHWEKTDFTVNVIRAIFHACKEEPALNVWYQAGAIKKHEHVNLGLALDSADGLFVPVIKHADQLSDKNLRNTIDRFKKNALERSFPQEDLQEATITLSNFGVFAGKFATPIVVPPTVAIIGLGKSFDRVALENKQVKTRKILPISITFDHRAATGGEAARFMAAMLAYLHG